VRASVIIASLRGSLLIAQWRNSRVQRPYLISKDDAHLIGNSRNISSISAQNHKLDKPPEIALASFFCLARDTHRSWPQKYSSITQGKSEK